MSARPRVFVTRRLPGGALERLAQHCELAVWAGRTGAPLAGGARRRRSRRRRAALPADGPRSTRRCSRACPRLRVISSCSVGVDHIDLAAARRARNPRRAHARRARRDDGRSGVRAAARRGAPHPEADRFVREGRWSFEHRWDPEALLGRDVHGATLGIVGLGAIGQALARRASGFGMRVLGWSRIAASRSGRRGLLARGAARRGRVRLRARRAHAARRAACSAPRDRRACARGRSSSTRRAAASSTRRRSPPRSRAGGSRPPRSTSSRSEPLDPASPLLAAPNLLLTPHIGSASIATRTRMADLAVENLLAGLAGRPLPHRAG